MKLSLPSGELALDRCLVMGIVNRTPDSFYDGGRMSLDATLEHARSLVAGGADILDVGAVKAGPGEEVPEDVELDRLVPVVEALAAETRVPLSVETARPSVARAAIAAGAAIVNDVSGLADEDLAVACAETRAALVLMHHGGQIRGRPRNPRYTDVVAEVKAGLQELTDRAQVAGVARTALVVDPGLDFGKNTFASLELMRRLEEIGGLGFPLLVAPSRKDVVGETLDLPPAQRLEGTLALVVLSVLRGAHIVRVHDVVEASRAVRMTEAVEGRVAPLAPVRGLWE